MSCDIIAQLKARNIDDVIDFIFSHLDWHSLKNVSLVSKAWREAFLAALKTTTSVDENPKWTAKEKRLWEKTLAHLSLDFHVSTENPNYILHLTNSMKVAFELNILRKMTKVLKPKLEVTLDYLPFNFEGDKLSRPVEYHFEMSEKFIVAYDPKTELLNYWSRRTLLPLKMDRAFQMRKYPNKPGGVGMTFQLSRNFMIYGEIFKVDRADYSVIDITKVDLDAKSRGISKWDVTVNARLEPPNAHDKSHSCVWIRHLGVVGDLILLILFYIHEQKSRVSVLWKVEEAEGLEIDLSSTMLQITSASLEATPDCFFDASYFVAKWSSQAVDSLEIIRREFRSFSIHTVKAGRPAELHPLASFELADALHFAYKDGLLASASKDGIISFVDVTNGAVIGKIETPITFPSKGCQIKLTDDYLVCSHKTYPYHVYKGTHFYFWDLQSIIGPRTRYTGIGQPNCVFRSLTGRLFEFRVDELGIVALMESDPERGFQVLRFLPACNRCKRVTKPTTLKTCIRCKSATYCSKECQVADWNPHHKAICGKVEPMKLRNPTGEIRLIYL